MTNKDSARRWAGTAPAGVPADAGFAAAAALGEVADVVLTGQRMLPKEALGWAIRSSSRPSTRPLADVLK